MKLPSGSGRLRSEITTILDKLAECVEDQALFERTVRQDHLELLIECASRLAHYEGDYEALASLREEWCEG